MNRFRILTLVLCSITLLISGFLFVNYHLFKTSPKLIKTGYGVYHVRDWGRHKETLIIEPGLNCKLSDYSKIHFLLSSKFRVIAYDHAGIGKSEQNVNPRTLPYFVEELRDLLKTLKVKPPYTLIGHSLGGHTLRYFAYLYPDEIKALIILDGPHEDWFDEIERTWPRAEQDSFFSKWNPGIKDTSLYLNELQQYIANCDSIRNKPIPTQIPVLLITTQNETFFSVNDSVATMNMRKYVGMQHKLITNEKRQKQVVFWDDNHLIHSTSPFKVSFLINAFLKNRESKGYKN